MKGSIGILHQTTEGETTYFVHKVRAHDLPSEIEHEGHLGRTLRFDTMKSAAQCHQHPLILIHEYDEDFHCVACTQVSQGMSFKCTACPFRVHQKCVSSNTVKLPFHCHKLKLIYPLPQNRGSICCQICLQVMKNEKFAYHCARCKYFIHVYNCRPKVLSIHEHPLVFVAEGATPNSSEEDCFGCGLNISVPYYVCIHKDCSKFFLHKICAEVPQTMEHHLHPGHALTLSKRRVNEQKWMCHTCHSPWEGFGYSCAHASCCFNIDIMCVTKSLHSTHDFHQHTLFSSHIKPSFACHACNMDSQGPTYQCTTCRFWVHQLCASVPKFKKYDLHPHWLKLAYSLPDSLRGNREYFRCHVCREEIQPHRWAYYCAGCRYFTHVHNCSNPYREMKGFNYEAALAASVHLPVANGSVSLATLCFMGTNQEEDRGLEATPQDVNGTKSRKMLFLDSTKTCHKCMQFLDAPCNNCALCKYFLPKSAPELLNFSTLFRGHLSNGTGTEKEKCRAFSISSTKLRSVMKISSSVLPRYVKHKGHGHVLSTTYITKPTWCDACENDFIGYGFRCSICDFTIDTYCALLPGSISHRYDKKHPFKLTFYSIEDVEEYVCEICEEDITTMWFYHCEECDQSIHPRCIWNHHIKFGPFMIGSDNQELTLVPTVATASNCVVCKSKETTVCRYSLFSETSGEVVHLQCSSDTKLERWPRYHEQLMDVLDYSNIDDSDDTVDDSDDADDTNDSDED